ncbi:MAG: hypothetical protein K2H35_06590, partial [Muribaculaceae bacterium]|nr:hypothetical protein [Muribaculaceae bacterium]
KGIRDLVDFFGGDWGFVNVRFLICYLIWIIMRNGLLRGSFLRDDLSVRVILAAGMVAGLLLSGCGSKGNGGSFPADMGKMSDAEKVAYVMKSATPDSVARFICRASLGDIEGVRIDTLANATLYAYETYKDADLQSFAQAYDSFAESLPLDRKMKLRKLAAEQDPMGLGYELGLEYVNRIRMDRKSAASVEAEINALKKVCSENPDDSATFTRFMKGFKVALTMDGGADIPLEIYHKYRR